jgi:hypothetical protein
VVFSKKPLMLKWLAKQRDSGNKRDLRQIIENFDELKTNIAEY